jgi:hypothetical protein
MKARRFFLMAVIAAASGSVAFAPLAHAQVAVGPGFVVAPFVHVQWTGGQVHVCAPFVNVVVDLPGCCGCRLVCGEPTRLSNRLDERLEEHPTRQQLAQAAGKLYQSLEQFQTADGWRHYLSLSPDGALSAEQLHKSNSATDAADLVSALRHFDAANRDGQYHKITTLPAFQQTHALLANYLAQQPNSLDTAAKAGVAALTNATFDPSLPTMHSGWAVDTARALTPATAGTSAPNTGTIRAPETVRSAAEELPPPAHSDGA